MKVSRVLSSQPTRGVNAFRADAVVLSKQGSMHMRAQAYADVHAAGPDVALVSCVRQVR